MLQDCGFYYPKDDVMSAVEQLYQASTEFDDNAEAHYNRSAACLYRHLTTNPDNILGKPMRDNPYCGIDPDLYRMGTPS